MQVISFSCHVWPVRMTFDQYAYYGQDSRSPSCRLQQAVARVQPKSIVPFWSLRSFLGFIVVLAVLWFWRSASLAGQEGKRGSWRWISTLACQVQDSMFYLSCVWQWTGHKFTQYNSKRFNKFTDWSCPFGNWALDRWYMYHNNTCDLLDSSTKCCDRLELFMLKSSPINLVVITIQGRECAIYKKTRRSRKEGKKRIELVKLSGCW